MDLGEEEREEARVAVAQGREEREELSEVVARAEDEGVRGRGQEGEDVGEGAGDVEELLDLGGC